MTHSSSITRTALSEIPIVMGRLSVSSEDLPLHHPIIVDVNDVSSDYFTPTSSPDEYVIRQRGRRSVSIAWSPDKNSSTLKKTPTKSSMTLRSSPRKRLNEEHYTTPPKSHNKTPTKRTTSTPNKIISSISASPSQSSHNHSLTSATKLLQPNLNNKESLLNPTISKRLRFEEKPIVQQLLNQNSISLNVMLKSLSNDQLIDIIQGIIKVQPKLEDTIRQSMPMADIKPMEEQLLVLKKNIHKSLPLTRDVRRSDSKEYSRALTHLITFKQCIKEHTDRLYNSQHWDSLLDYSLMAWNYVRLTPIWTNNTHNTIRKRCFKMLTWYCSMSLKFGGLHLGERRLNNFSSYLEQMISDYEPINLCEINLNNLLNVYQMKSLTSTSSPS